MVEAGRKAAYSPSPARAAVAPYAPHAQLPAVRSCRTADSPLACLTLQGHGGTSRLVLLPHESHGYSARESVMHTLYEVRPAAQLLLPGR